MKIRSLGVLLAVAGICLTSGAPGRADILAPTEIPGSVLWLDATDAATITMDFGEVTEWRDKSAVGTNHFTQVPDSWDQNPSVSSSAINGLDVLTFDGFDDCLVGPAVLAAGDDDYTYFAVWQPHKDTGLQRVFEQYELNVASRYGALLAIDNRYGFNGQNNDRHDLVPLAASQWRLTDMEIDNSLYYNVNIYDNGARFEGRSGNPAALDLGTTACTIGAKNAGDNAEFLQGDLAELIVYDRALDYEEHNEVGKYLSDKYGLGITFPLPEPPPPPPEPELVHQWTFNGNSLDSVGDAHGALQGDVEIVDGQLNLNKDGASITGGDRMVTGALGQPLGAKTLVAWCSLNDLFNSAGGPLSVQEGGTFDAITFGERQNATWFAGSSNWHRSQDPPQGGEVETKIDEEIMLAIAYNEDNSIDIYRDGVLFNSYTKGTLVNYGPNAVALIGPRADTDGFHNGTVNESRIYNYALDADEIAALYTEGPSTETFELPKELVHRWSFNDGTADDSAGEAHGTLEGGAEIIDGRLSIDGFAGSRMITGEIGEAIWEKTMVVWTSLNDPFLSTMGSALTIENNAAGDIFDAIVYGEAAPQKWMNGSNFWARTDQPQTYGTEETVGDPDEVMIAITYAADNSITVYREGELYGTYTKGALTAFGANALVQIGPRHANHADVFDGFVNEARIYSYALTAEEIAQIFQLGSEVVSGMEWDGGSGNWADGNWNGGQPPMIGVPAILDTADSVVTVTIAAADFLPAQSVAIGETNAVTVVVEGDATLSADGEITVGNSSILQVDGTLTAASASVAGMLSGNGTINVEPIEILGTVAPGGNGIGTLTVGNGEMGLAGSATYDAQVSLAAVNAVTADQIAVSSTGALQLGGTLTVTSLGDRTDADSWANPKPKVVNNTLGSIGDIPTGTGFEFDTVTPTPGTTAASHIGQGAFLQGVTYVKAPTNPPITTGVELDLFVALGGDADGDGKVWLSDWAALRANFGNTGTGKTWTEGNFDPWVDDKVWLSDWAALRANFGNASYVPAGAAAVPEPGTIAMLLGALLGITCCWKRRSR